MNIEYFQELVELARRLNYREAAGQLKMSQSALSKHIKTLEAAYGARLFERDRQSVTLTAEGAVLVEYAQQIWNTYEKSKLTVTASQEAKPIILAGVVESPDENRGMNEVMHYLISHGSSRHVQMRNAESMSSPEQIEALCNGLLDCFVGYNLTHYDNQVDVRIERICELPLDVVVSSDNALASKDAIRYTDMAGAAFVHLAGPKFTPTWHLVESLIDQAGIPHTIVPVPTNSIYDYLNIELGNRLLVMPRRQGYEQMSDIQPRIKIIPVNEPTFKLSLDAAFVESRKDASLECLIAALKHCYGKLMKA